MTGLRCGKVALSGGIMLIALSLTAGTSLGQTCSCCTASPQLSFTTGTPQIGGGGCGTTKDSGGAILRRLDCGGLYFGGAGVGVPLPAVVPDLGQSILNITACSASTGALTLGATTPADSGSNRNCSAGGVSNPEYPGKNGCLFGPPLPIPNASTPATSSCVVNRVAQNATGSGNCTNGSSSVNLPLLSDIYLTGDLVSNVPGIQPCPVCLNGTCNGGPRSGLPCTPADSASLGAAYPTSHDCPPPRPCSSGASASRSASRPARRPRPRSTCLHSNLSSAATVPPRSPGRSRTLRGPARLTPTVRRPRASRRAASGPGARSVRRREPSPRPARRPASASATGRHTTRPR